MEMVLFDKHLNTSLHTFSYKDVIHILPISFKKLEIYIGILKILKNFTKCRSCLTYSNHGTTIPAFH